MKAFTFLVVLAASAFANANAVPEAEPDIDAGGTATYKTFTKTIGYHAVTHKHDQPDCGSGFFSDTNHHCPTGCSLQKLTYGNAKSVYQCKPEGETTTVGEEAIIAHLRCRHKHHTSTHVVTPAYGKPWTTCAHIKSGSTKYAPAITVAVETKAV
jgi:hypothetical protein